MSRYLLLLWCLPLFGADVEFLPCNVLHADTGEAFDGLVFYFNAPPADQAAVTITAIRNGKPVTDTQVIDTDREHGDHPDFDMVIDEAHRHELVRMIINIGASTYTIEHPIAGKRYSLAAVRYRSARPPGPTQPSKQDAHPNTHPNSSKPQAL